MKQQKKLTFSWFHDLQWQDMNCDLHKSLERGIAVEINSSYLRDLPALLELCEEINPYVSVASDMHKLERLGEC